MSTSSPILHQALSIADGRAVRRQHPQSIATLARDSGDLVEGCRMETEPLLLPTEMIERRIHGALNLTGARKQRRMVSDDLREPRTRHRSIV